MPNANDHPQYFRLYYDEAEPFRERLTPVQRQKLIGAMAMYYLFQDEPHGLSQVTQMIFDSQRKRLDNYRNRSIGHSKNWSKTEEKNDQENQGLSEHLPAETQSATHSKSEGKDGFSGKDERRQHKTTNTKTEKQTPTPHHDQSKDELNELIDLLGGG